MNSTKIDEYLSRVGAAMFRGSIFKRIVSCLLFSICFGIFVSFISMFSSAIFGMGYDEYDDIVLSLSLLCFIVLLFRNWKPVKKYYTNAIVELKNIIHYMQGNLIVNIFLIAAISYSVSMVFVLAFSAFFAIGPETLIFAVALAFLVFILLMNSRVLSYLSEIGKTVDRISKGDYSVEIPEKYTDELGMLAKQINKMAADLSEAKHREELSEQRKNEFITSVAHDLRTPLTSINGYLGLITGKDGVSLDDETRLEYAEIAYRKSQRLEQLINEFFDFSKYNLINVEPQMETINIGELIEQLDQEFYPQYSSCGLKSRITMNGKLTVFADGNMLARVFDNIITNAVRYGKNGKYIDIEVSERKADVSVNISNYASSISDTDISKVFDKFYRVEASRNPETGGAGLGLSIAKSIVEAHGGVIKASSVDGKTTFEVSLPKNSYDGEIGKAE